MKAHPPGLATHGKKAGGGGADAPREIAGVKLMARVVEGVEMRDLKSLADEGKTRLGSGIVAIVGVAPDGKAGLVVGVTEDLTGRHDAVALVRAGAEHLGGKGGEIDLIVQRGRTIAFVEVKARAGIMVLLGHDGLARVAADRAGGEARGEETDAEQQADRRTGDQVAVQIGDAGDGEAPVAIDELLAGQLDAAFFVGALLAAVAFVGAAFSVVAAARRAATGGMFTAPGIWPVRNVDFAVDEGDGLQWDRRGLLSTVLTGGSGGSGGFGGGQD
mgnify:CR=1 FL=1